MSDKNDHCPRCDNQPYYDGHLDWCNAIRELEERVVELERQIRLLGGTGAEK